jgi:FlgD Ig-like domain
MTAPPLEEVYVFQDSLDGLSLDDEGGWTHYDNSGGPPAWHIDTFQAWSGHAWWCGRVDSTWIYDSNRAGYDNSWTQMLQNKAIMVGRTAGSPVKLTFSYRINVEKDFDRGIVQIEDIDDLWLDFATVTGKIPNQASGCDSMTIVVPDSLISKWGGWFPFRFVFESDISNSSADGQYDGDGWIIDNVRVNDGTGTVFFYDNMENGPGAWIPTTNPAAGDYWTLEHNVTTEDLCTDNRTNVWADYDQGTLTLVPWLDDRLITPSVAINRSATVLVAFDVYRNLPLNACFYYSINFRTRNVGANWGPWTDPTGLLYYGSTKDWIRQKVPLVGAGGRDSVQVMFIVKDYGQIYCGGPTSASGVYPFFDNIGIGILQTAPPSFVTRDLDLFQDTFRTTAFWNDDNFNTPLGDSVAVSVNASRGYKTGYMYYRFNSGSFTAVPLQLCEPSLPNDRFADVPPGNYPGGTVLQYYFAVTDSVDSTAYYPINAPSTQKYLTASILPVKTATNPALGCTDSLATILFVNNNYGRETEASIAKALTAQGFKFDTWDVNGPTTGAGNTPGGSPAGDPFYFWPASSVNDLLRYSTIIWHAGSLAQLTIQPQDEALIQSWIQQPGKSRNFWLAGDDVAHDLIVQGADYNSFLSFTVGASYTRDLWENFPQDTLHPVVQGLAGTPTAGRNMHVNSDCPIIEKFDLIAVSSSALSRGKTGTFLKWPNNFPASTRFATKYVSFGSDSARSVFESFNFNDIEEGGERLQLVKNIMTGYFGIPNCYYASAVDEDASSGAPPVPDVLFQNAPNPFNPETTIRYSVSTAGKTAIRIYSVSGALVRTLVDRYHAPGIYSARWDGRDGSGRTLASGVYFYRLETTSGVVDSKKLLMLK